MRVESVPAAASGAGLDAGGLRVALCQAPGGMAMPPRQHLHHHVGGQGHARFVPGGVSRLQSPLRGVALGALPTEHIQLPTHLHRPLHHLTRGERRRGAAALGTGRCIQLRYEGATGGRALSTCLRAARGGAADAGAGGLRCLDEGRHFRTAELAPPVHQGTQAAFVRPSRLLRHGRRPCRRWCRRGCCHRRQGRTTREQHQGGQWRPREFRFSHRHRFLMPRGAPGQGRVARPRPAQVPVPARPGAGPSGPPPPAPATDPAERRGPHRVTGAHEAPSPSAPS